MAVTLPSKEEIQEINRDIIRNSRDPDDDPNDAGKFFKESPLKYALDPTYGYGNVSEAAYGLAKAIANDHVFRNGNKRTATEVVKRLFALNGFNFNGDNDDLSHLVNSIVIEDGDDEEEVRDNFINQVSNFFNQ